MKLIVTGGGTGGHIYPAIAIANKFREMDPNNEIVYAGYIDGIERDVAKREGFTFKLIDCRGLEKKNLYQYARTALRVGHGLLQAFFFIKKFKPDAIIGTGGYVCFPTLFVGSKLGVKCFVQEQNAFPGRANQTLEKGLSKVFLGFEAGGKYFKQSEKMVISGNPVREAFFKTTKEEARKALGFEQDDFVVLTFGGSLGAVTINDAAFHLVKKMNGMPKTKLVFGTGKWYYEDNLKRIKDAGIELADNVFVKDYMDPIENYIIAADIIVCRAGATSVAEITACSKASVMIPSPNVVMNHQFYNAKAISDRGGAVLIEENDLDPEKLVEKIMEFKENPQALKEMETNSGLCSPGRAVDIIYDAVMQEIGK